MRGQSRAELPKIGANSRSIGAVSRTSLAKKAQAEFRPYVKYPSKPAEIMQYRHGSSVHRIKNIFNPIQES
jgi:hypothetical protein